MLYALIRQMRASGLMRDDSPVEVQAYLIGALMQRGFELEFADGDEEPALARGRSLIDGLMTSLAAAQAMPHPEPGQATDDGRLPGHTGE